jgi:molybdenum cofactor biosynthesis enzyme MoaA
VESTTRCNAWCPFCPRNKNGFGLAPDLNIQDLQIERLKTVIDQYTNLNTIQFCGNYGDPLAAKNFDEQINLVLSYKKIKSIQISTNGSFRNKNWWKKLTEKTKNIDLEVIFGLDGNQYTHNIYRQGTDFEKIIQNAKTFINAGGHAVWQFILFDHNKDSLMECYNMSNQIGFKKFTIIKNHSPGKKSYHYKTGKELYIKSPDDINHIDTSLRTIEKEVKWKDCLHNKLPSMYLAANGNLHPCCYLTETEISVTDIKDSFKTKNFFSTCLISCGSQVPTDKSFRK